MIQDRCCFRWLNADAFVSTGMAIDPDFSEYSIGLPVLMKKLACCFEAVYKRAFPSRALSMGEKMQSLQSGRLGEIGIVVVRLEVFAGICSILARKVGCEVIEATWKRSAQHRICIIHGTDHHNECS